MRAGPRGPPSAPPPARSLMRGCGKSPDVPSLEGLRARGRGAPGREQLRIEVEEHRSATLGPSRRPHRCSTPAGMAKTAPAVSPGGTTRAAGRCQAQKRAFSPQAGAPPRRRPGRAPAASAPTLSPSAHRPAWAHPPPVEASLRALAMFCRAQTTPYTCTCTIWCGSSASCALTRERHDSTLRHDAHCG